MIVKACIECPLFRLTPVLGGILSLLGTNPQSGFCSYERETKTVLVPQYGLPPGPERETMMARLKARMIVEDNQTIPGGCPLRDGDVSVSLGS